METVLHFLLISTSSNEVADLLHLRYRASLHSRRVMEHEAGITWVCDFVVDVALATLSVDYMS